MRCHLPWMLVTTLACSGRIDSSIADSGSADSPDAPDAPDSPAHDLDIIKPVVGIADQGRDPAVVAIEVNGEITCSGTLIATNVVLTARRCVSKPVDGATCPGQGDQIATNLLPATLAILLGDDMASATVAAHGKEVIIPFTGELCDHDMAAVILDADIDSVAALKISKHHPERDRSVRTVGFTSGMKLLREFVKVTDLSPTEFEVGEATCKGDAGGPALDPTNGEIMGVVSRAGSWCEGPDVHNVYARADAFGALIDAALQEGLLLSALNKKAKAMGKPPTNVGDPCASGSDCSTGVCVLKDGKDYCSHVCDAFDRCPTGFKCALLGGKKYCLEK